MFGSVVLEIVVGLTFIYLLLSLLCSAAKEGLEALMKKRAIDLERGIKELLADPKGDGMAKRLYEHPIIDGLFKGDFEGQKGGRFWTNLPSYIPARQFALALIDVIHRMAPEPKDSPSQGPAIHSLSRLRDGINMLPDDEQVKGGLLALVAAADDDLNKARGNIEAWFNDSMDRVAGWYKRWSQAVILVLGLLLVVLLNADTIAISNALVGDPSERQALITIAQESVKKQSGEAAGDLAQKLEKDRQDLRKLGLPIGWDRKDPRVWPVDPSGWAMKVLGLLLTVLAISLGAPFWFDVLNKFMVVRSTVKPQEKSPKEKSKN
jgi:hypothetical protein